MNAPLQTSDDLMLLDLSDTDRETQLRGALTRLRQIESLLEAARHYDLPTAAGDLLAVADDLLEQAVEIVDHVARETEPVRPDPLGEAGRKRGRGRPAL